MESGVIAAGKSVADAVSVFVGKMGFDEVTTGVTVTFRVGGGRMRGVAVKMSGVPVGGGDKMGNGCGVMPQMSQDVKNMPKSNMINFRFMFVLYRSPCQGYFKKIKRRRVNYEQTEIS